MYVVFVRFVGVAFVFVVGVDRVGYPHRVVVVVDVVVVVVAVTVCTTCVIRWYVCCFRYV